MLRRTFLFGTATLLAAQQPTEDHGDLGSVVWIQNGTLWIRYLPDGAPRALAAGTDLSAPKFSPSGRWILFNDSDDLLRVISADGTQSKSWVTAGPAQWLPGRDCLTIDQTTVLSEGNGWSAPVAACADPVGTVSEDGQRHAWVSDDSVKKRLFVGPFGSAGESKLVAETEEGGFEIFSFIRGGSRFLYWTTDEDGANVWSYGMDIRIGDGAQPVNTGICTLVGGAYGKMVALSPTADTLAAAVGGDHLMYQDHSLVLADVSTDGKSPVVNITGPSVHVVNPAWSPDGRRLAWSQGPDAEVLGKQLMEHDERLTWEEVWMRSLRERRIWLAADGGLGHPVQLTNDSRYGDQNPVWSRDGKYILFVRTDEQESDTLWLMRADGSDAREVAGPLITTPESDQLFDWSFAGSAV
jgi:dipeptidyl aminopeptidase/acylaminoacyl peptidase